MKKMIFILITLLSFQTFAWQNCGQISDVDSNCEYDITGDGTLIIRPIDTNADAIMPTYQYTFSPTSDRQYETTAPWFEQRKEILNIQIEDGIKNISNVAFMELRWVVSATMADTVVSIGSDAFTSAFALSDVTLSKNLEKIGHSAFQNTYSLTEINLPEGINNIDNSIFNNANNITSLAIPDSLIDSPKFLISALNLSAITTLYCSKEKEQACADYIARAKNAGFAPQALSYELYEKWGTGYLYKGKFYDQLGDIGTPNHIKKRIYTIGEANQVAGTKNRISIRYR